ncbi:16S rRNA (guanine(966)-N(2))-methyltransferase RsmD [Nitratireductor sp. XY-223]|uniref:16S rRNA (guanine(966)-N(2))-methyltransferase RsmD n=1 Tax=Nitratireductor sp. XY-223 TaxID=2561926 RepID=UPI0010A9ADC0|nr:16S rRNA (guanine(966)-N(2))-methyltransferase RsmD [Nitratireductor sp. XY-223]
MRIVGGSFKGRSLAGPRSQSIRPTTDRTREALFNILAHAHAKAIEDKRVLDLFAGTGALGLEALSRGARFSLFVEKSAEGRGLLRANIEKLGVQGRSKVYRRDAAMLGEIGTLEPFDLVFADPPYGRGLGERALAAAAVGGWLRPGALVLLEERAGTEPRPGDEFNLLETRSFGDTAVRFFRYNPAVKHD